MDFTFNLGGTTVQLQRSYCSVRNGQGFNLGAIFKQRIEELEVVLEVAEGKVLVERSKDKV